ncbi:Dynein heavy chain 3, axonemal, partial [Ophiophagus hannah]
MEDEVPRYSDSQPLTPEEQFIVMRQHEEEMSKGQQAPTEEDLERYCYYIHKGIRKDMLAPQDENMLNNILTRIPSNFLASPDLEALLNSLMGEIQSDYQIWLMKNIVDYILMDPDEKKRLFICNAPQPFPQRVIRAPVPWHKIYQDTKLWNETHLFTVNPMMLTLQQLWFSEFSDLRFVRTKEILEGELPLLPSEFEELIRRQWIPRCADLFIEQKEKWLHLAPQNDLDSCQQIEEYFASVAILMSLQLREMDGNDFGDVYQDMQFFIPQILVLKLDVEDPSIIFDPDVRSLWDLVYRCFIEILKYSEGLPKVQVKLFPELKGDDLIIRTVNEDEALVADYVQKTAEIFDLNLIGPQKYLNVYRKYNDLLNNNADKDVTEFLSKRHELEDFVEKIDGLTKLKKEIASLHVTVPLALFCLDALKLNEELCNRTQRLKDRLIEFEVEENRNLNKSICNQYNIIADKVSEVPLTTEQLVELTAYLKKSSEVTVFKLRREIREAIYRLEFLMDYADLPSMFGSRTWPLKNDLHPSVFNLLDEDIRLNSTVLHWPDGIEDIFDTSRNQLMNRREQVEIALIKRLPESTDFLSPTGPDPYFSAQGGFLTCSEFEAVLEGYNKEVESFRKKDVMTMEEMKNNVEKFTELSRNLDHALLEYETINKEEELLEREKTQFPLLQTIISHKIPFEQLWVTAYHFHHAPASNRLRGLPSNSYFIFLFYFAFRHAGPVLQLNSEEITEDITNMWRTMYKLTKTFIDLPGPKRMAENVKFKIDKFKQHLPVLSIACNHGMKDRHWEQISEIVGYEIRPDDTTSLMNMLEYGLSKYIDKIEPIGAAASKEYSLEKNMEKMKTEWVNIRFTFVKYRDTDTSILSAIDDIQLLLDDHIIKTQTMCGSPFIKPIEAECRRWEEKLLMMQEILDNWLKCQATWLYLEPIFSSEDIIAQMPEEGRKFGIVDAYWKDIMTQANFVQSHGHTSLTKDLVVAFRKLVELGYLVEVVETKDPLRVQPHLKKCFEGIAKLEFTEALEITGMISSEKEVVPFIKKIFPVHARGMVEKWLLQVEEMMLASIRQVMENGIKGYDEVPRKAWVLQWPGQVVICVSSIFWTKEAFLEKSNRQIGDIVELVRGKLSSGARLTLGALTVIDVHARDVVAKLSEDRVSDLNDFQWISQLRYYWENRDVMVRMITTEAKYGYEYLGNSLRLVITPLTDRCYRTLMGALKLNLGGAPEGPAGTGKTETTKDLAKALAKQILSIQQAIIRKLRTFLFEGTEISLNPTCAVFITMNPGYAGRAELPDNLKALFRTVAMMVPDYALIGEISLYSMGFLDSRSLAQKIVATYRLCSEQLSSQHHYDYGMRAVKSVLTAAGNLKLKYPVENESVLLLRALLDGIISDLFPGIVLPQPDYVLFIQALNHNIEKMNLQPVPWFIGKIIQIYEMMMVRHGFMIVGEPMGGKTFAYKVLAAALGDLSQGERSNVRQPRFAFTQKIRFPLGKQLQKEKVTK